jgi:spore maturation protein CgeB
MKFTLFYHSLVSDWNHGNAHFLRGVVSDLLSRGHQVKVFEPANGWSRENLLADHGPSALEQFQRVYPQLTSELYDQQSLDLHQIAEASDVIIVHEWNEAWLVNELGNLRNRLQMGSNADQSFLLLFHDTHHRAVSEPGWIKRFQLEFYDGILAFGEVLSDVYRAHGWHDAVWTWHEAADDKIFYPRQPNDDYPSGDLVWIGNWGDDERTRELETFLFRPVRELNLSCHIYGVRYPSAVLQQLRADNINYCGWLPNFRAPEVFANHAATVHVPRRYYAESLPGIPTIRPFESMACGIPLISAPWQDSEQLFTPGEDFLVAHNSEEMQQHLHTLLADKDYAQHLADRALNVIRTRHTCSHRVDQLLEIIESLGVPAIESVTAQIMESIDAHFTGGSTHAYH